MENTYGNNSFDVTPVFKEAKQMLEKGIAKVCYFPVAALNKDNELVSLTDPNAYLHTPSGAIITTVGNQFKNSEDIKGKISHCLGEIAKQLPQSFVFNYELAVSIDLACLEIPNKEILSAFDRVAYSS